MRIVVEFFVDICDGQNGVPVIEDIWSGSPTVCEGLSPEPGELQAPFTHAEVDMPSGLIESLRHYRVSNFSAYPLVMTVVVLEIIDPPGGVGLGVYHLVSHRPWSSLASLSSSITEMNEVEMGKRKKND